MTSNKVCHGRKAQPPTSEAAQLTLVLNTCSALPKHNTAALLKPTCPWSDCTSDPAGPEALQQAPLFRLVKFTGASQHSIHHTALTTRHE